MRRRAVLGGIGGLLATSGCLSRVSSVVPGSGPIVEREFTAYDPESDFFDAAPEVTAPPRVTFEPDESRVRIVGKLFVGSSSCNRAVLERATYDEPAGTLHVDVGSGRKAFVGNSCTADESVDAYRALVTFAEQLPARVVAKEDDDVGDTETTVRNPATDG